MKNFELTERGKIIIAIVLVLLLLVIPAVVILGMSSCSDSLPPDDTPPSGQTQAPHDGDSQDISSAPLPTASSGVEPSDPPEDDTLLITPDPTPEPTPSPTPPGIEGDISNIDDAPVYGPVGLNLTEGTMLFIFAPDEQDELDEETSNMLGEFLSSPVNTSGAIVRVSMPHISDEDEAILITAVRRAFTRYGVSGSGLEFAMGSANVDERHFEVALSFTIPVKSTK